MERAGSAGRAAAARHRERLGGFAVARPPSRARRRPAFQRQLSGLVAVATLAVCALLADRCQAGSIELVLFAPEYPGGGQVSVNGYVGTTGGTIERLLWDWGDGTTNESWFPALHRYQTNGDYLIQVTAFASTSETRTESVSATVTDAEETNVTYIALDLGEPDYSSCGGVSVNGFVGTAAGVVERLVWDWGDGTTSASFFPAQHQYATNGSYTISVTAYATVGLPRTEEQAATISNIEPACANTVGVYPPVVVLTQGRTNQALTLDVRTPDGRPLPVAAGSVRFTVLRSHPPDLVQVSAEGVVSSHGLGSALIQAEVEGQARTVNVPVVAGEIRIEPPLLLLSVEPPTPGQVTLRAFYADGSPVNLAGHSVTFLGGNAVAQVDAQGVVTPLRPPADFWETPYLTATLDGMPSHNACVVRVTQTNLDLAMEDYSTDHVTVLVANQFGPYPYGSLMTNLQVSQVLDAVYRLEHRFCGTTPVSGGRQFFVLDPGVDADGTVPCGLNGNPIRLGAGIDNLRSCFGAEDWIHWGVMAHELAHNFLSQATLAEFLNGLSNPSAFGEGLTTALGAFSLQELQRHPQTYGLASNTVASLSDPAVPLTPGHIRQSFYPALTNYEAHPNFAADFNADLLDAILFKLGDAHGPGFFFRLLSVFYPPDEVVVSFADETQRLTFWVAACSAAARTDLRARFRDAWGWPLDDAFYEGILPRVSQRAAQRDPVIKQWFVASNILHLVTHAVPDTEYQLQSSADLLNWTGVQDDMATAFTIEWALPIDSRAPNRFFRVLQK